MPDTDHEFTPGTVYEIDGTEEEIHNDKAPPRFEVMARPAVIVREPDGGQRPLPVDWLETLRDAGRLRIIETGDPA